jgi:transcriptional regulator with XRE-family HTH domain
LQLLHGILQVFNAAATLDAVNVQQLGSYIRRQRQGSRLSLSKVSGLAGVSIPYLSQVERGLRKPSAEILQAIAKALRISAETLYVEAGILEARPTPDVPAAILADPALRPDQKHALVQIYDAFRAEAKAAAPTPARSHGGTRKATAARGPRRGAPPPAPSSRKEV